MFVITRKVLQIDIRKGVKNLPNRATIDGNCRKYFSIPFDLIEVQEPAVRLQIKLVSSVIRKFGDSSGTNDSFTWVP